MVNKIRINNKKYVHFIKNSIYNLFTNTFNLLKRRVHEMKCGVVE